MLFLLPGLAVGIGGLSGSSIGGIPQPVVGGGSSSSSSSSSSLLQQRHLAVIQQQQQRQHNHQQQQFAGGGTGANDDWLLVGDGGGTTAAADHFLLPSSFSSNNKVCLGFTDLFIAFVLILLILATVFGNVLVVLSVFLYKRMRTFTNFLLTSLATADLLVGLLIMPLALYDLLHNHNWPLGRALCRIWATFDVLLCTASILNLCIISLDRYMAITSPLRYPRTRSRWMACALLSFVWGMAFVVCSPPWFVNEWRISFDTKLTTHPIITTGGTGRDFLPQKVSSSAATQPLASSSPFGRHGQPVPVERTTTASDAFTTARHQQHHQQHRIMVEEEEAEEEDGAYQCAYPMSVSYRIYSASVSFYIPLVVMLFVYFKIFRVASERERLIREGMGTCRLSRRVEKTQLKGRRKRSATTNYTHRRSTNAPKIHEAIHSIATPTKAAPLNAFGEVNKKGKSINPTANHCSVPFYSKHPSRPNPTPGAGTEDSRASFGQISPTHRSSILPEGECDSEMTICPPSARTSGRSATAATAPIGNDEEEDGIKNNAIAKLSSASSNHRWCTTTDSFRRKIKSMECLGTVHNFPLATSGGGGGLAAAPAALNKHYRKSSGNLPLMGNHNDDTDAEDNGDNDEDDGEEEEEETDEGDNEDDDDGRQQKRQRQQKEGGGQQQQQRQQRLNSAVKIGHQSLQNLPQQNLYPPPSTTTLTTNPNHHRDHDQQHHHYQRDGGGSNEGTKQQLHPRHNTQMGARKWSSTGHGGGTAGGMMMNNNCTNNNNNHAGTRNSMAITTQQPNFTAKNANFRGSKEKIVYLRERKALKTIGIVVLGFIICWLPFFVVYVLEVSSVLKKWDVIAKKEFQLLSEFFLWLGYSNSVLNPLIYTMYNSDFRRCFRDLLGMGCMNQHRRTMSVKKLHQQSNLF